MYDKKIIFKNTANTITISTVHYSKCKLLIDRLCIQHIYYTDCCVVKARSQILIVQLQI